MEEVVIDNLNDEFKDHKPSNEIRNELKFSALKPSHSNKMGSDIRRINVPPNRFSAVKSKWLQIYTPVVEQSKLQIRMNVKRKCIEIRTSPETEDIGILDRASEFVRAFVLGFEVADAEALIRMEDMFVESFDICDVKELHGDHLSRAIGRIAGKDGKTKFAIENSTRTRIVLAEKKVHLMGSFQNIKMARDCICNLIIGAPPGKVYTRLKVISSRLKERS